MYPGSVSGALATAPPATSLRSSTVTDHPACASKAAATSPFGPEPITTASAVSLMLLCRSQPDDCPLGRRIHRHGPTAQAGDDGVDLVVGTRRIVVEQQHLAGARFLGQAQGVLDRRVAHERLGRELGSRVLGVVDQEVDVAGQGDGRFVVRPEAVGALAVGARAVIGEIGDGCSAVADAVAEGAPALVRDLAGQDLEALDLVFAFLEVAECPSVTELTGPNREVGRREGAPQELLRILALLG